MFKWIHIIHIHAVQESTVISYYPITPKKKKKKTTQLKRNCQNFSGGSVVGSPPANTGDIGSSPRPGRSHMPWSD